MLKKYLNKEKLHHAYLFKNTGESVLSELKEFLEDELKFSTKGNPDFWCGEFDTFGINNGREIIQLQSRVASTGDIKVFVIIANFFTTEAQNSLLKMFEEPTSGTHFFVITQNTETLLPTLRSRLFIPEMNVAPEQSLVCGVDMEVFLRSKQVKRIELLKEITEVKDKNMAISFLNELEKVLYEKSKDSVYMSDIFSLKEIIRSKKYLNGRAPSVKMILEHIVLVVPVGGAGLEQ